MLNFIQTRLNPTWYHGHDVKPPFFEGWYFKVVNQDQTRAYAFIPGIFMNPDPTRTHSFVQVLDGIAGKAYYHPYSSFYAKPNAFDVQIATNFFKQDAIRLNIQSETQTIRGELHFSEMKPMPNYPLSLGIMGYFGWFPFMECNHGLVSFDHHITGQLEINGEWVDFTGGRGYIEKDWGTNFPSGYVWMQTNHFSSVGTSFFGSIAVIPNFGRKFAGFTSALWHDGQLYRFATYNGSSVQQLVVNDTEVHWTMFNRQHELIVIAQRAEGGLLMGPEREAMHKRVDETMQAKVHLTLNALKGFRKHTIFTDTGTTAGLEVVGDLRMLLKS